MSNFTSGLHSQDVHMYVCTYLSQNDMTDGLNHTKNKNIYDHRLKIITSKSSASNRSKIGSQTSPCDSRLKKVYVCIICIEFDWKVTMSRMSARQSIETMKCWDKGVWITISGSETLEYTSPKLDNNFGKCYTFRQCVNQSKFRSDPIRQGITLGTKWKVESPVTWLWTNLDKIHYQHCHQ